MDGLVLAGGGLAGIAWETGVLRGIADAAPEAAEALLRADVLVGTSAGSTVAAQLSSGRTLDELFTRQLSDAPYELQPGVDIDDVIALFAEAGSAPDASPEQRLAHIGTVALSTETVPEALRRRVIEHRLPSHDWSERTVRITAIDVATGELVVFDRHAGVSLVDAVAASCAVPGVWPPLTVGDRRYMDGGVGSTVNTSVAADCTSVVVLIPSGRFAPSVFGAGAAAEVDALSAPHLAIFADEASLTAFGPNPLDPACRTPSALAGRDQGRREAAGVAAFLGV